MIPKSGVRFSDKIMRRKREAERREAHPTMAASPQTSLRSLRKPSTEAAARRKRSAFANHPLSGALASRRTAAALVPAAERQDSAQAALHANGRARALPAPSLALKPGTWLAGLNAGGDDTRTARERGYEPRPQEPHSLRQSAVTGDVPRTSEMK